MVGTERRGGKPIQVLKSRDAETNKLEGLNPSFPDDAMLLF